MADDPRDEPSEPSEEDFRDMLRDFLAGDTDMDPAKLASAAGLPNDPELVQRLIGQLQQALQNSTEGINWGLALEQAKGLAARSAVPATPAEQSALEQAETQDEQDGVSPVPHDSPIQTPIAPSGVQNPSASAQAKPISQ